jgi:ABC-type uncharacterized transport system substrate-binding protein
MDRRAFIGFAAGGLVAIPLNAPAQQPAMPVIGYLGISTPELYADRLRSFRQGLNETGYVEGRNVAIEFRWADNHMGRLPDMVADLVRRQVAVIAAAGITAGARAAQAATTTIPIVFTTGSDPVQLGLVASMNKPGGNLTGVSLLNVEVIAKRVEVLHELLPAAARFGLLVRPADPIVSEVETSTMMTASRKFGLQVYVLNASTKEEIDSAFATFGQRGVTALVISSDGFFFDHREQIVALAARHSIPAIHDRREFAAAGGLISYGASILDAHRQLGVYTGLILSGKKPADLPVVQPTKFDLVINQKAAKGLGITIPQALLLRADEVIQ